MVRHDPVNQRGPAPPSGQPRVPVKRPASTTLFTLRPVEEYERLWAAGKVNLDQAIRNIKAYLEIGLPGADAEELEEMSDRLVSLTKRTRK